MTNDDAAQLNFAVGLLMGLHSRQGDINVLIYHDKVRVKIEWIGRLMVPEDLQGCQEAMVGR